MNVPLPLAGDRRWPPVTTTASSLLTDGTIRTWGYNATGQLGDGSIDQAQVARHGHGINDVMAISAGRDMSYAIVGSGSVKALGR